MIAVNSLLQMFTRVKAVPAQIPSTVKIPPECNREADRKAGQLVVAWQIDRNCFVLGLFEERHHEVPVPCNTAGTRDENESCHA
jgi:hypothetical protein